jgi:cytosine/adenosine deaminase-related metal-dependent hydrolase
VILRAAWVIPVTAPPIRDGWVELRAERIAGLGQWPKRPNAPEVHDLGDAVLLPGLVNPHTHLEQTAYADRIPPCPFWAWIARMIELRRAPGQLERERAGVRDGAWQSLRAGVTCVGDISRRNLAWRVLRDIPIRKVCFVELLSLAEHPPRNPQELRAAAAEVVEDELLTVGISPHAPYTVPAEHLRAALSLAHELDRPWCTHWAETREEVEFLRGDARSLPPEFRPAVAAAGIRSPRMSPIAYLESCRGASGDSGEDGSRGYVRPGALAHVNYLEDVELETLARSGHTVIYCPRAHHYFGHEPHPFPRLRAAGVRVAIGTDGRASNWGLSMLEELRHIHEHVPDAPAPDVLLRLATIAAAAALRLDDRIGAIEPGRLADLAAFPCRADAPDPVSELIASSPPACAVWVSGRRVI